MARVLPGPLANEVRGSVGETTFRWVNGRQVVQRRSAPTGQPSDAQLLWRRRFISAGRTWSVLGNRVPELRTAFEIGAQDRKETPLQRWASEWMGLLSLQLDGSEVGEQYPEWDYPSATPGTDLPLDYGRFRVTVEAPTNTAQIVTLDFERSFQAHRLAWVASVYNRDDRTVFYGEEDEPFSGSRFQWIFQAGNTDIWVALFGHQVDPGFEVGGSFAFTARTEAF